MSVTDDPWLWPPKQDVPVTRQGTPIKVYRWHNPADGGNGRLDKLDNVNLLEIVSKLAPDPGHCVLEYRFGTGDPAAPADATEATNSAIRKPKIVNVNDCIAVYATQPDGRTVECIFVGYALAWAVYIDAGRELVRINCPGMARRCSDTPIRGALYRQGNSPESTADEDQIDTDIPAHFNPKGIGNCPGIGYVNVPPTDPTGGHYAFIDATNSVLREAEPADPRPWYLPDAVRYLLFYENKDQKYVKNPRGKDLDATLKAFVPLADLDNPPDPVPPYDPSNPQTYATEDIPAPDYPATGKPWPHAVHELIAPHGFAMAWDLTSQPKTNRPVLTLRIFHPQRVKSKDLLLQPRGSTYDPARTNMAAAEITRDLDAAVNRWEVHGELIEYEASFVLAQNFPANPGDDDYQSFDRSTGPAAGPSAYREFILDEAGEGHYQPGTDALVEQTPADLDLLLGKPITLDKTIRQYAYRRRPPIGDLISTDIGPTDATTAPDPIGRPLKWSLAISTDYATDASLRATTLAHDTPTGGSWTVSLAFKPGETDLASATLAWNTSAAAAQTAIAALPNVGTGNVVCSGGPFPGTDIVIQLAGDLASTPTTLFGLASALTGDPGKTPQVTVAASTAGKGPPVPGLWDGSGTWQPVAPGSWALDHDRVGVRFTGDNPNKVHIGKSDQAGAPYPGGTVKMVESLANPQDPSAPANKNRKFWLRLTCVIRGDKRLKAITGKTPEERLDSPLGGEIVTRIIDAHDRYKQQIVFGPSEHNDQMVVGGTGYQNINYRNDTPRAEAEATQIQVTTLNGLLQGPVKIGRFTRYYLPGDRIRSINGRAINFRADQGTGRRSVAWLPVVTEVRWLFGPNYQQTLLTISDADVGRGQVLRGRGVYRRPATRSAAPLPAQPASLGSP